MQGIDIHAGKTLKQHINRYIFLNRESESGKPMPNMFVERDPSPFSDSNTHLVYIFQFRVSTMTMRAMTARQGLGVELKGRQKS